MANPKQKTVEAKAVDTEATVAQVSVADETLSQPLPESTQDINVRRSFLELVKHLIKRRQIPNAELGTILEPLAVEMSSENPGLFQYESDGN